MNGRQRILGAIILLIARFSRMPSVGIDLGTTNSCVAVVENGQVDVIANNMGRQVTPSIVAFDGCEVKVGEDAKELGKDEPERVIRAIKRLMGREFSEDGVKEDIKERPYGVIDVAGRLKIQTRTHKGKETFYPEEISGMILKKMKDVARERIGVVIRNAVITVPAHFNDAQRGATMDAARIAGLHVLQLLNEPTAAALAHAYKRKNTSKRIVLVYDLGGGTFDVSLVKIEGTKLEVIATDGDQRLGGDDFDKALSKHIAKKFEKECDVKIVDDKIEMAKLTENCERAKTFLSKNTMQRISFEAKGKKFKTEITRSTFVELNRKYFERTFVVVEEVLREGQKKMGKDMEVDEVVLAGGSARIPFVEQRLNERFPGDKIRKNINPDEVVAYGAAVQAASLSGEELAWGDEISLQDVIPLSLGTDVKGNLTSVILKKNTKIPEAKEQVYVTTSDYQSSVNVDVFEGERAITSDNHRLGGFKLDGIPLMPKGKAKVVVRFSISKSGILDASAFETTNGNFNALSINLDKKRFTEDEIRDMRENADKYKQQDDEIRAKVAARNDLEDTIYGFKRTKSSKQMQIKCEEVEEWLNNNKDAEREVIVRKQRELEAYAYARD